MVTVAGRGWGGGGGWGWGAGRRLGTLGRWVSRVYTEAFQRFTAWENI